MRPLQSVSLSLVMAFACANFVGCNAKKEEPTDRSSAGRALLEQTIKEFHNPSGDAAGADRGRLLEQAAARYEQVLKEHPDDKALCAQAMLGLGSIRASQGKTNDAVKLYATVSEKYPDRGWDVLQAWKAAADLLWDAGRHEEAKKYYARIVERFDKTDAPMIAKTAVRGSKSRLAAR